MRRMKRESRKSAIDSACPHESQSLVINGRRALGEFWAAVRARLEGRYTCIRKGN